MAADSAGNDLSAVAVPYTGFIAWKTAATAPVEASELAYALPTGYSYLGLITQDGGYAEETEAGERIEFFQRGYSLLGSDGSLSFTVTLAENSEAVRQLLGYDAGTVGTRKTVSYEGEFGMFVAVKNRNGKSFIRAGIARVTDTAESKAERGAVTSYEVTFEWKWMDDTGFYRFKQV